MPIAYDILKCHHINSIVTNLLIKQSFFTINLVMWSLLYQEKLLNPASSTIFSILSSHAICLTNTREKFYITSANNNYSALKVMCILIVFPGKVKLNLRTTNQFITSSTKLFIYSWLCKLIKPKSFKRFLVIFGLIWVKKKKKLVHVITGK